MSETFPQKPKPTSNGTEPASQTEPEAAIALHEGASSATSARPDWLPPIPAEPEAIEPAPLQPEPAAADAGPAVEPAAMEAKATAVKATPETAQTETIENTPAEEMAAAEAATVEVAAGAAALAEEQEGVTLVQSPDAAAEGEAAAPDKPHIVELVKVCKWFDQVRGKEPFYALKDFDFKIEANEDGAFVVLLGPSGCGKSTILSLISGLSLADKGEVRVNGHVVNGPNPESATVPQAYTCYPWRTVLENVEFGLLLKGLPKQQRRERALEYLRKVDLADRYDAYPKQLSGGMQQRVAIARTLAMQLPIVLMDEPFGALDAQTRSDMQQTVLKLWNEEKNTIIFVTHDITEALLLGDRVIVFSSRPAQLAKEFKNLDGELGHERPPEVVRKPEFIKLYDDIRQLLKKQPAAGTTPLKSPLQRSTGRLQDVE